MTQYAKALHDLAVEHNKIDQINFNFDEFKTLVEKQSTWTKMMDSPMLSIEEKLTQIDELSFDSLFLSFLKTLVQNHLMRNISEIYEEWIHLVRATQKIAHIHVYLAKAMSIKQEEKLIKILEPRFKDQHIHLHKTIDTSLLGGMKVVYHGQSLDRSIARELEELFIMI